MESWEKTSHAKAFSKLRQVVKAANPECLLCHTTAFREPGGFLSIESTPKLANVQCEECHGFAPEHISGVSKPRQKIDKKVCEKCHTKMNSPDFNYSIYYDKVKH